MSDTGFVPFPNEVLDTIMPELSANGWKVFCFVWRKTRGWQKTEDHISISQIMDGTGIGSNNTVKAAIKDISKIITVENSRGRGNLHRFDISTLNIKDAETAPLNGKDAKTAPIKPLKDAVFDVKDAETAHTTDTIQQTKDSIIITPPENLKIINTEKEAEIALRALTTNYEDCISVGISPLLADEFKDYSWQVRPEWVVNAYKATVSANVQNWNYPRKILDECIKAGRWSEKPKPQRTKPQRTKSNGHSKKLIATEEEKRLHAENVKRVLAERKQAAAL